MRSNLLRARRTRRCLTLRRGHFRPVLETLEDRWLPSTVNWIGGSGNFNVAANWRDTMTGANRVPGPSDDAVIPAVDVRVTISDAEAVNSLVMQGGGPYPTPKLILAGTGNLALTNTATAFSDLYQLDLQSGASLTTSGNPTYLDYGGAIDGTIDVATTPAQAAALAFRGGSFLINSGAHFVAGGTSPAGTIQVVGGTVSLYPDLNGDVCHILNFNLAGGTLTGAGNLTVDGTFTWTGGDMGGGGTTVIAPGATLAISGAADKHMDGRTLNNLGTASWTGDGSFITDSNNSHITSYINNSGSFTISNDQYLGTDGCCGRVSDTVLTNTGTLTKTSSTDGGTSTLAVAVVNPGTVSVTRGVLSLNLGGTSTGTFDVQASGTLSFTRGTYNLAAGTQANDTGLYSLAGGTLAVNPGVTVSLANFSFSGGLLGGTGTLTATASFTWTGGDMGDGGTTVIAPGATLAISGASDKRMDGRTLNNQGTATWAGTGNFITDSNNSHITSYINNSGSFSISNDQYLGTDGCCGRVSDTVLTNTGTLTKTSSTDGGTSTLAVAVVSPGSVSATRGVLSLNLGGTGSGNFDVETPGVLSFTRGTYTLQDGATLTGSGYGQIAGATVSTMGANVTAANIELDSGALGGSGTLEVTGRFTWTGGDMGGGGTTVIDAGATLTISGTPDKRMDGRTLNNQGTATWAGTGNFISDSDNTRITSYINNSGSWTISNDQYLGTDGCCGRVSDTVLTNTGTLTKTSSTDGGTSTLAVAVMNTGTVSVTRGVLSLNLGGANSGNFDVETPGVLSFTRGTYTLQGGATLTGTGYSRVAGTTVLISGTDVTAANIGLDSGTLAGPGTLEVTGSFAWTGGTLADANGTLLLDPGATMSISGTDGKTLSARTLNLDGNVTWSGGTITLQSSGIVNLGDGQGDGTFTIAADGLTLTGSGTFRNRGLLIRQNLPGTSTFQGGVAFLNDDPAALLSVPSGILEIDSFTQNAGTTSVSAGARLASAGNTLTLQGGELTGAGTVMVNNGNGTLENVAGTISPGGDGTVGTLTIAGSFINDALGTVNIDIADANPGDFDQLMVTGTVTLNGGILNANFLGGYQPADTDRFPVLVSQRGVINGSPGDFNAYNANGLDPSYQMSHQISGGSLTLTVSAAGSGPQVSTGGPAGADPAPIDAYFGPVGIGPGQEELGRCGFLADLSANGS